MCVGGGRGGGEWIEGKKFNQSTFGGLEIFQTTVNPPNYKKWWVN